MSKRIDKIPEEFVYVCYGEGFRECHINPITGQFIYTHFFEDSEIFENMELVFKKIDNISFGDGSKYLYGEEAKQKIREACADILNTHSLNNSAKSAYFRK